MSEVIERDEQSTELVTLPRYEDALQVFTTEEALDALYAQVEAKLSGTIYDMTTAKGRAECASDAYKVARSKTAVEKLGAKLSAEYKEIPKKIDASRRRIKERFEVLQEQIRQPLTEWEQAEERRINEHKQALQSISDLASSATPETSADVIRDLLTFAEDVEIGTHWDEFEAQAARAKDTAVTTLRTALAAREKYEAEARAKRDEEERIAREAAERATREAEAKAQAEREAAARREAEAKASAERAERERLEAVERQKQAEARAEAEKVAAEQRAKNAAEAARLAEIERQEREKAAAEAEQRRREADREHKAAVMGKAKEALMTTGITEEQARSVVLLIAADKVPSVRIHF